MGFTRDYTMTDYWDGPRGGIADFDGLPHVYESEWSDAEDDYAPTYRLSPVTAEVLKLALEDWAIWERWSIAFHAGTTTRETHPALPEDRMRHEELKAKLQDRLQIDPENFVRARGKFRGAPGWDRTGLVPLEVEWERC